VPKNIAHSELIAAARREIRALPCPREVRCDGWRTITDLLAAIAGYLPDCWPSERTLAKKLGKKQQAVHRTLVRARELGLVVTTVRPLESSRDGQSYHLVCLSEPLRAAISRQRMQTTTVVKSKNSYSVGVQDGPTFGGPSWAAAPPAQTPPEPRSNVVPFNRQRDEDWESPAFGEDPKGALPATTIKTDPAVHLARQFDRKWVDAKRTTPALRVSRSSDRGMATGHIRNTMLRDHDLSPEHVEAHMDAFIAACVAGDVIVKEGQFAFEKFSKWWGREDVEDPTERLANKATAQWVLDQVRLQRERNG
jgi:hypothetical protein